MSYDDQPTIDDAAAFWEDETFIGRGEELDTFRAQLTLGWNDRRRYVLNVFGEGGVGKSTLLREFGREAANAGAAWALTDDNESDAPAAMARLAEQLDDAPFRDFRERYRVFRQRRGELEADPDAPSGMAGLFGRAAVKVGAKVLRNTTPGADLALDFIEEPLADQAGRWAEFVRRKLGNRDEAQLVLEPEAVLTPLFVAGLRALSAGRQAALAFDTYERSGPALDPWLHDLLTGRYGSPPAALTFIVAGRGELDRVRWADRERLIARFSIDPFTEAEARAYLAAEGVSHERVIEIILEVSQRLPLLVATLAGQSPTDPARVGDATGTAIECFLKWVDDPGRRALALNGALPRRLNRDVAALLGGTADDFDWLQANRFIDRRAGGGGWTYHEVVRGQMLRYLRETAPGEWTARHERLAEHYEKARDGLGLSWAEGARNKAWRVAALEALYHRLCAQPDKHLAEAVNEFVAALDGQWALARPWAGTLAVAGRDVGHGELTEWGRVLQLGLEADDNNRHEEARLMYDRLLTWPRLEVLRRPIVLSRRGATYAQMGQYDKALADFDRAIDLDPQYAGAIALRGETYRLMGEYDKALADFDRAIELEPSLNWAIALRGETYRQMGEHARALAEFDRAIELDPQDAWAIASRGQTYGQMGEHAKALADFDRAIELDPQDAGAIASRGITHYIMGSYAKALVDLDNVIDLNSKLDWAIAYRGRVYRMLGRYTESLRDLNLALEMDSTNAASIASRGETFRHLMRYDEALADFDQAIALDPTLDWAFDYQGRTYLALRRYDAALINFEQAVELDPQNDWYRYQCATMQRFLDPTSDWRADLDRAVTLAETQHRADPTDLQNLFNLAVYRVAQGDAAAAEALYRQGLDAGPAAPTLRDAIRDLDEHLRLFHGDELAAQMRALLRAAEGQTTGAA